MKRTLRSLALCLPLFVAAGVHAEERPHYDAYSAAGPALAPGLSVAASPPAFVASTDARRGVPTFLWAARSPGATPSLAGSSAEAAARRHLERHAARYGLSPAALSTAVVTQVHDLGRGGIIVVLRQRVGQVELFRSDVKVLMTRDHALVAIGGNLHAEAMTSPKGPGFAVPEARAIATAFADLHGVTLGPKALRDLNRTKGDYRYYELLPPAASGVPFRFDQPARVRRVYFPLPDRIVPAYYLELQTSALGAPESHAYAYVIAADDGRLLYRENLTHGAFSYRVWADPSGDHRPADGPIADYTPYPAGAPNGSYPAFTAPQLISIDGFNSKQDPWLPVGATETRGNNVDAFTDDDAPDGFSANDIRATITGPGTFDRIFDPTIDPQASPDQKMASITDLFYVTNWLHDWWYDSGFDEAGGNAQASNYGRGGLEGDVLHAQGQDGRGEDPQHRNNSNMSVPADGQSPRMQMYLWDGKSSSDLLVSPIDQHYATGVPNFGPPDYDLASTPVVLVNDGTGTTSDACEAITNDVSGKIALIDRGSCTFQSKVLRAQTAGAAGVIIVDNKVASSPPALPGDGSGTVTIPSLSVTQSDGAAIKAALSNGAVSAAMSAHVAPDRDGTIDNTVIAHEWGHYLHLRNVACGSNMCGAESEGWADFTALQMVVREGDNLDGAFGMAAYATQAFPDDPGYFGIRRYPYSVDMTKNPLTFKHISDAESLPTSAPMATGNAQAPNSEVHASGEVWAMMLFEGYVALLKRSQGASPAYSFDEARRRMADYVVGGMKLAPTDPTFTEQRDGVLATAAAADTADFTALAQAFAGRGAGSCAVSPARDSDDNSGVVESFVVGPNPIVTSVQLDDSTKSCDSDGHLDSGESGKLTLKILNAGPLPLTGATVEVSSKNPGASFPGGAKTTLADVAAYETGTVTLDVALDASIDKKTPLDLHVTLTPSGCLGGGADFAPLVNFDDLPSAAAVDDVESETTAWVMKGNGSKAIWSRVETTPGDHAWRAIDFASPSDTHLDSPALEVGTGDFVLTFEHRHSFEESQGTEWDGGIIEVSADGGSTWKDISTYGDPGYGGVIGDSGNNAQNPIGGQQGYVGQNASWPARDTVSINLGKALSGKTVKIRFRVGTDQAKGDFGWELDKIGFKGITNQPFHAIVTDTCGDPAGTGGSGGGTGTGGSAAKKPLEAQGGGCGCRTSADPEGAPLALPLAALAALALRRRRR